MKYRTLVIIILLVLLWGFVFIGSIFSQEENTAQKVVVTSGEEASPIAPVKGSQLSEGELVLTEAVFILLES